MEEHNETTSGEYEDADEDEDEEFLSNVLVVCNLSRDLDTQQLEADFAPFSNGIKELKHVKLICTAVVVFQTVEEAIDCRILLLPKYNIYFGKPIDDDELNLQHLMPPINKKNFLISPPVSPPPGWQPLEEPPPVPTRNEDNDEQFTTLLETGVGNATPAIILERDISSRDKGGSSA